MSMVLQRLRDAVNEFAFYRMRRFSPPAEVRRVQYAPQPRIVQQSEKKEQKVPLFGQPAGEFGFDYLVTKSIAPQPVGPRPGVPRIEQENIQGRVSGQPLLPQERPYEDANTSMAFQQRVQDTDQKAIRQSGGAVTRWDGTVRNSKTNSNSPLSFRQKSQLTPGDLHKIDLERADYDFSG